MTLFCPPQALEESFQYDFDDNVFMYGPPEVKVEKVKSHCLLSEPNSTYTDLSTSELYKHFRNDVSDNINLLSWTQKHPQHWSSQEVLDWIYYVADVTEVDYSKLRGESFQNVCGFRLCHMTRQDFINCDSTYGAIFFETFKVLINDAKFIEPPASEFSSGTDNYYISDLSGGLPEDEEMELSETSKMLDSNLDLVVNDQEVRVCIDGEHWYDIDLSELPKMDIPESVLRIGEDRDSDYHSGESDYDAPIDESKRLESVGSVYSDEEATCPAARVSQRRRSSIRRRLSSTTSDEGCDVDEKKGKNRGRKSVSKGNHLWEFIRDLLKDPHFNPTLLRWEDKESGVFRFVQSEAVAQMWGRKKNNPGMTYEKLSRAMRYYYKRGILDRVDGRRLVYKFGTSSHGWQD